ncbi:hypothetical protein FOL47_006190 [Perkinsus chesapeaki]|uniref:Uncharacterized protein n=1 Tax=Perkinsus chesapeaki TaxID=330153 RepID=A0A7J6LUR0_PERCH|nr:hypothetical protein FOL47_006190 [Perkinsus chesapeaki]
MHKSYAITADVPSSEYEYETAKGGPPNGASSYRFLNQVVNTATCDYDVQQRSSALSEAELRKLRQPTTACLILLGLGTFGLYNNVAGLTLTSTRGKTLALDVKTWLKEWGFSGEQWSEAYFTRLLHKMSLAKLSYPLRIAILDQALHAFETCLANKELLTAWTKIDISLEDCTEAKKPP